jgi:membrane protease YdiL (CAAX protease family)
MFRRRFWRALALRGTHPLHLAFVFLLAVPMLLVAGACGSWAREILPDLKLNDDVYAELAKASFPLVLFAGCVLPGVAEELFFRGFLGRGLVARHGFLLGLLFSSVLFGVAHMNPPQIVATGLLGCGFHLVFLSSKSLVAPMLAHALNNGMAFTLMKYGQEIKLSVPGLTDDGHVPLTIAAAGLAATGGLLLLFYYTRARWFLPDGSPWQPGYVTAETPPVELDARVRLFLPPSWTILLALVSYGSFVAVFAWQVMG